MARFRATIKGQRGEVSRLGSKISGIVVNVNGWKLGIKVKGMVNDYGKDVFEVSVTAGSDDSYGKRLPVCYVEQGLDLADSKIVFFKDKFAYKGHLENMELSRSTKKAVEIDRAMPKIKISKGKIRL